jgi:DNA polymerase elongation subunit (family B)
VSEPKILLFDLETAPILAYTFGVWNVNISMDQIVEHPRVLCWSARWVGTKGNAVMFNSEYATSPKEMLQELRDLLDEADFVVGYNSDRFDVPWTTEEFMIHGIDLPSPYVPIDLFKLIKKHIRFPINKLDYVSLRLMGERKVQHRGFRLWVDCMDSNSKNYKSAWKEMEKYAKKDTLLLEPLFNILKPFIKVLNYALYNKNDFACTHCGSQNLQARGTRPTQAGLFQRYQCNDCQGWSTDPTRIKTTKLRPMSNN